MKAPFLHIIILTAFLANTLGVSLSYAQEFKLSQPGVRVHLSPALNPPVLKGIKIDVENPFRFEFILDPGNSKPEQLRQESTKLIRYFLASLTIPEKDLWVNLSPYEKNRIIPESFGQTEMGRDLLAEDYMLKQITASLIYPEEETGKKFWKRVYEEAARKFGTTNIPVNTFNKVWIMPEKALVYENVKTATACVVESKLKVMLEEDYKALEKNSTSSSKNDTSALGSQIVRENLTTKEYYKKGQGSSLASSILREIILPQLTKEINEGKNFAQLRQVYQSLILATWYKKKIKNSVINKVYTDKSKISGVNIKDPKEKEKIYQSYLLAFKKGAYNYIKEEMDAVTKQVVPRKYFSGGITDLAMNIEVKQVDDAAMMGFMEAVTNKLLRILAVISLAEGNQADQIARKVLLGQRLSPNEEGLILRGDIRREQDLKGKEFITQQIDGLTILFKIERFEKQSTSQGDVFVLYVSQATNNKDMFKVGGGKDLQGSDGWSAVDNNYVVVFQEMATVLLEGEYQNALAGKPSLEPKAYADPQMTRNLDMLASDLLRKILDNTTPEQRIRYNLQIIKSHEVLHEIYRRILKASNIRMRSTDEDEYLVEIQSMISDDQRLLILSHIIHIASKYPYAFQILQDLTGLQDNELARLPERISFLFLGQSGNEELKKRAKALKKKAIRQWQVRYSCFTFSIDHAMSISPQVDEAINNLFYHENAKNLPLRDQDMTFGGTGTITEKDLLSRGRETFFKLDIKPGERVLDIGAGPLGGLGIVAAIHGAKVVAYENSPEIVGKVKEILAQFQKFIQASGGSYTLVEKDFSLENSDLIQGSFDHIIATDIITATEYAARMNELAPLTWSPEKRIKIFQSIARLKNPLKGSILFSVPELLSMAEDVYGKNKRYLRQVPFVDELQREIEGQGIEVGQNDFVAVPFSAGVKRGYLMKVKQKAEVINPIQATAEYQEWQKMPDTRHFDNRSQKGRAPLQVELNISEDALAGGLSEQDIQRMMAIASHQDTAGTKLSGRSLIFRLDKPMNIGGRILPFARLKAVTYNGGMPRMQAYDSKDNPVTQPEFNLGLAKNGKFHFVRSKQKPQGAEYLPTLINEYNQMRWAFKRGIPTSYTIGVGVHTSPTMNFQGRPIGFIVIAQEHDDVSSVGLEFHSNVEISFPLKYQRFLLETKGEAKILRQLHNLGMIHSHPHPGNFIKGVSHNIEISDFANARRAKDMIDREEFITRVFNDYRALYLNTFYLSTQKQSLNDMRRFMEIIGLPQAPYDAIPDNYFDDNDLYIIGKGNFLLGKKRLAEAIKAEHWVDFIRRGYWSEDKLKGRTLNQIGEESGDDLIKIFEEIAGYAYDQLKASGFGEDDALISEGQRSSKSKRSGGIDLKSVEKNLQVQDNGEGQITLKMDFAQVAQLENTTGFVPVIISIEPINNIPQFLGFNNPTHHVT